MKKKQPQQPNIQIPKQAEPVQLLMQAIKLNNPHSMRILAGKALDASANTGLFTDGKTWNETDLNAIIDMIRGVNPNDFIEVY